MFRTILLVALATVAVASVPKGGHYSPPAPYPGYNLKPILTSIGLPGFSRPKYSLGGLFAYLRQTEVTEDVFIGRIKKYRTSIRSLVHSLRKQYSGILADLLQLSVLRYYGCEPRIQPKIQLGSFFGRYLGIRKYPTPYQYNAKYVSTFLTGFKGYVKQHVKPQRIIIPYPKPTPPSYPGYELLEVFKSIGLPHLYNAKYSLGGVVSYLKIAKISQATFVSRIQKYGGSIKRIVYQYKKQYSGYQADLLQLCALRYYGISQKSSKYTVSFIVAFKQALKIRVSYKYSISYVSKFLVRFSKIIVTPTYPGYKLKAVLQRLGLPHLYNDKYTLGGLVSYLKIAKISQATFVSRIQKYGGSIKRIVYQYKKQYSGYQADLLQLCALRYYGISQKSKYTVSFIVAFRQALKVRVYYKYSVSYVSTFLVKFSKIIVTPTYPGYKLKAVLHRLGLPHLYNAKYTLGGLVSYLKIAKISQATFVSRIQKYGGSIKRIVYQYKKQYSGYQADLLQLCALRYYGISQKSKYTVSFIVAFKQALKVRVYYKYSVSYVSTFLVKFSRIIVKPAYPGYQLKAVLQRLGLPRLYNAKYTLGGLVSYLKIAKISQATFVSRIQKYSGSIKRIVYQYKKQYSGYQADLLQLCALRYYGISQKSKYTVSFIVAFKQALKVRVYYKYSVSYVSKFLVRFSKIIVTPAYRGYKLKAVLHRLGLPQLYNAKYSLGGLVSYLKIAKISQAIFISRIQKYGGSIKTIVYKYKKQYSGSSADLLQLCALRYYSFPKAIRRNIDFGSAFQKYLRIKGSKQYNSYYVTKFLSGFITYVREYQLKKYTGSLRW